MKKRIIPSILLKGGTNVCLSQNFKPWRTVGTLVQNLRLHINREADELLIINSDQSFSEEFKISQRILSLIRKEVDIPIGYTGGIKTAEDASNCINAGFDKVYITTAFLDNQKSIRKISDVIGTQSLGVCLPYVYDKDNKNQYIWNYKEKKITNKDLSLMIKKSEYYGAGEIILFNVSNDGLMKGLDLEILTKLKITNPSVPILLAGGAGKEEDFSNILQNNKVQGIVASSIFALTKSTPKTIREHCEIKGIAMRRI